MQGKKRSQQLCCVVNMFKTHLPPPPFACQRMISYNTSSFSSFPFFQTCYCIEHAASRARAPTLSLLSLITLCRKQYCMSNGEGEKEASLVRYVRKKPPTLQNWSKKKEWVLLLLLLLSFPWLLQLLLLLFPFPSLLSKGQLCLSYCLGCRQCSVKRRKKG